MPLHLQHERNGELIPKRWGGWHLTVFGEAVDAEDTEGWSKLMHEGTYVFTQEHKFIDPDDGETLIIEPGDRLLASR